MATGLTRQNRAGWMMAGPAFLLIVVFLILPFIMAIGFFLYQSTSCIAKSDGMGRHAQLRAAV